MARLQKLSLQRLRAGRAEGYNQDVVKFYYTYVLRSQKDRKLYIGWTDNLIKRIEKHNKGFVAATKNRLPLALVYYEACRSKSSAILREKTLKTGFGRKYLENRINNIPR